jgi:hypothetical protein
MMGSKERRAPGHFGGWLLTTDESKACYQYVYGLAPTGPHRPLADRLFESTRRGCEACGTHGVLARSETRWRPCLACEGTGGFWEISSEAVEAIRARVLEEFPEAAAPSRPIRFLGGTLVQNLRTGLMEDGGEG